MQAVLELENIKKSFSQANQKIEVLKGANLKIKKGQMASLIGPSGSGKTTILQIAGLLDTPNSGKILINGIDASKADDEVRTKIRKNHIGFVYQSHHLLPEFSALENAALPLLIQGKNKDEAFAAAKKILEEVGLEDRFDHKPSQLSGGQQQRVAIARALISKPSLILADEPTGNLDAEIAEKVFEILQRLVKTYEIGCLVVTHNLDLAQKSDKIFTIKNGAIE
jgi:lipoprotein-releasing system ATP-binding protein